MRMYLLDVMTSPIEDFIFVISDNMLFIALLLIACLVISSILFTVFVTKKHKKRDNNEKDYQNSNEDMEE